MEKRLGVLQKEGRTGARPPRPRVVCPGGGDAFPQAPGANGTAVSIVQNGRFVCTERPFCFFPGEEAPYLSRPGASAVGRRPGATQQRGDGRGRIYSQVRIVRPVRGAYLCRRFSGPGPSAPRGLIPPLKRRRTCAREEQPFNKQIPNETTTTLSRPARHGSHPAQPVFRLLRR